MLLLMESHFISNQVQSSWAVGLTTPNVNKFISFEYWVISKICTDLEIIIAYLKKL